MRKEKAPKDDPISPGHAAYFSPYNANDPVANRVTGMVVIVTVVDAGEEGQAALFQIRNVDNHHECLAFADELEEPW